MPPTPQPSNSHIYQQSLVDAREAWAKQSGLTQAQVSNAYAQAATSLGQRAASAPVTAPSRQWNLGQLQQIVQDYGANLDQRVLDSLYLGINASFHDSADSVLKTSVNDAYGSVFGPEAVDAHVRGVNSRAASAFITRTGKDGIRLSDRVWQANQSWRMAVQSVVQDAVISGRPPVQVAREIEQYLKPGVNVPYKTETAKRLKVPKDTSMPAMRVARTEMQNAFHEGTITSHGSMPSYLGIRWHIASGLGHEYDICDTYAQQGFFPKGTEPSKPHPHCFCTAVPVHKDVDKVLDDLEEWLHDPSSHGDLENYYQQMKPMLDLEVATVAGGSGGPLLGGYAKGEKVLIDVKGTEYIATIVGEHATKGVLTLTVDPGQGIQSIKVWRAPNKVKLYTGPPTQNVPLQPGPPQTVATGIDVGTTVHATKGQHLGKVGEVTSLNTSGGLVHVKWSDGSENNVVLSNLEVAPPPPTNLPVGTIVKFHTPEQPDVDGQFGTIQNVHPNGDLEVQVNINGTSFIADVPHVGSFKLEAVPPTAVQAGATGPQIIGYVDMPGNPNHGKAVINQMDANSIAFKEGGWAFNATPWKLSPTDPTAVPPPPPPPPAPPPTPAFKVGDSVQIDMPQYPFTHGKQGTVTAVTPTGMTQIVLGDGTHEYFSPAEIANGNLKSLAQPPSAAVGPQVPVISGIDHLKAGDKVKINDPGGVHNGDIVELYGPPSLFAANEHIPVILPDGSVGYVQKSNLSDPSVPSAAATVARPLATLDDLTVGDPVHIKQGVHQGLTLYLGETPAWFGDVDVLTVYATKADLASDTDAMFVGKTAMEPTSGFMQHEFPPLHQLKAGDKVILDKSQWKGQEATLLEDMTGKKANSLVPVQLASGQHADFYPEEIHAAPHTTPGAATGKPIEDYVLGDKLVVVDPNHALFGQQVTLHSNFKADAMLAVDLPTGGTQFIHASKLGIPPPATPPPVAVVPPLQAVSGTLATVNIRGHELFGDQVEIIQDKPGATPDTTVKVMFKTGDQAGYEGWYKLSQLKPYVPPAQAPPVTPPPGTLVQAQPLDGNQAQIHLPGTPDHGLKVEILQDKPGALPDTPIKVQFLEGPNAGDSDFFPLKNLVQVGSPLTAAPVVTPPQVVTPPPGAVSVDVTQKGTKIVTDYKGQRDVYGTVTSFNVGKNVLVIKPDNPITGMSGTTFTKNPKFVKAVVPPSTQPPPVPTVQTQTNAPPPPKTINDMKAGDTVIVNMPGSPHHGEEFLLEFDAAGLPQNAFVAATSVKNGALTTFTLADLVPPGTPIAAPPVSTTAPTHGPEVGGTASYTGAAGTGIDVKLLGQSSASSWKVELPDGSQVSIPTSYLHDFKPPAPAAPSPPAAAVITPPPPAPPPPPPPPAPVDVTVKGTKVVTDYQGVLVQGTVVSYNAGKKVVVIKPDSPQPGVPAKFTKSPGKVQPQATPPGVTPAPAPLTPTVATPPVAGKPVMPTHLPPDPPQPVMSAMKVKPQSVGGGHAKTIFTNQQDGSTWMFKPDPNAANAEKAGYNVQSLLGLDTPEIHVMSVGGQVGSMQRFHTGIKGEVNLHGLASLSAKQRAEIQTHQVVDWLISQHDSNDGAMLIGPNDEILAIDKGQAFKFLGQDKLDWTYKPNPNQLVYQPLFEGFISGKYDLDRAAINPILDKIEALDDDVFKEALKPYAEHAAQQGWVSSPDVIYDQLVKRKHTIRADFGAMYDRAYKQAGKPLPSAPTAAPAPKPVPTTGATANQATPIAQPMVDTINAAGWAGKTILVGGKDIESGQVLAYTIRIDGDATKLVIQSKVRAQAETKLYNRLDGLPPPGAAPAPTASVFTPPADPQWTSILTSLKHVGYHTKSTGAGDNIITPSKVQGFIDVAKQINNNTLGWDAAKTQHYTNILTTVTGKSIPELAAINQNALAADLTTLWVNNAVLQAALYEPYKPPPPSSTAAATPAAPAAPPGKFKARRAAPSILRRRLEDGELKSGGVRTESSLEGVAGNHEWYVDDLGDGMTMQYMPHYGQPTTNTSNTINPYARQGNLQITIENWKGTPQEIEHALGKMRELGLDANPATPDDVELLYLIHQVHAMKLEEDTAYTTMRAGLGDSTPIREQIEAHQKYLSGKLGKDITKLPSYNPTPQYDPSYRATPGGHTLTDAAGRPFFERVDITRADLDKQMKGWYLGHSSQMGTRNFIKAMLDGNGAPANTEERVRQALFDAHQGMSSVPDMFTGGANYFFTRLGDSARANDRQTRGPIWFSKELLLQTDMLAYHTDLYGRSDPTTKRGRNTTIKSWKENQRVRDNNEVIIKNGFGLLQYLERVNVHSVSERDAIIQLFKDRGIDQIRGVPVEDIVQVA